ncbi:MAG TPA: ABC transporter ATP-binding protein [Anaerolineaceae bacterium]|nr:ABC transporter ATP-binding protein [Anaerolineaceae bacterium]
MSVAEFTLPQSFEGDRRGPVRWVVSHGLRQWPVLLIALIGAFGNAALASVVPVLTGQAVNTVMNRATPDLEELTRLAIIMAGTQLLRGFIQFMRNGGFEFMAQAVERSVREELYVSLLGKSMTFHNLQPVGDTMARATNDVREVNYLFSPGVNVVVGSLNFLIMPLVLAPRYHPSLILVPALFVVLYAFTLALYMGALAPVTDQVRAAFGRLNTRLAEALDGIETVKAASQEEAEVERFKHNVDRYRLASIKQGDVEARFLPLLVYSAALAGGLFHALVLFRQGQLDVGQVVGYFGVLMMLDFPTYASLWAYSRIASGLAGARRILELMNRENNLDQNEQGYAAPMRGKIEFRHATFAYDDGQPAVEDITFTVEPGQTVAIVGQTGSGKTTLARLVNRTYDVTSGQVLVDGVDVRDWQLESLRQQISIIEQDIFLFSQSIHDNIAFGRQNATREEVEAAAKSAQAHEFITSFNEGYDTIIGERGVTLSGGQRQRLALSRAFLTNPSILILDDSTSAIDSATEDRIQQAIFEAARGRTTLIITHRLSQIRWADLIVVMRRGRVAAVGTHDELMATSQAYRNIFSG